MIKKLKLLYSFNKGVFKSVSYLTVIQIVAMILPFLTYPYLIRTLGLMLYGKIMLAQAVVSYIALFINFGFNVSAVKSVAESLNDKLKINEICSAIILVKVFIWLSISIVFFFSILYFVSDYKLKVIYFSAYTLTFNEFLVCQWFYQAKEDLKIIAVTSIVSKVINVILVFTLIKTANDFYLVSLITGVGYFITGLYCTYHLFKFHISYVTPAMSSIVKVTKDSLNLFLTSAVIAIKNKSDVMLIGVFISPEFVAVYDFAQKILNVMLLPITIINNALFSKMNREKSSNLLKKIIIISLSLALFYTLITEFIIEYVMHFIFITTHDSVLITRLMMISVVFFSISLPLAQNGLIVFGHTKLHLLGMLSTSLLYVGIIFFGYVTMYLNNVYYFIFTSLFLFGYEVIYRLALCKWKKII